MAKVKPDGPLAPEQQAWIVRQERLGVVRARSFAKSPTWTCLACTTPSATWSAHPKSACARDCFVADSALTEAERKLLLELNSRGVRRQHQTVNGEPDEAKRLR